MAAKKLAEPPKPKLLPQELHTEIDGLTALAKRTIVREALEGGTIDIEIAEDKIDSAVNGLTLVRALVRNTKKEADTLKGEVVPKEITDKLKGIEAERKSITGRAEEIEADLEEGLLSNVALGLIDPEHGVMTDAGCKLAVVTKKAVDITDLDLIDDAFLLPREKCIDWEAVKYALLNDVEKAEAAKTLGLPAPKPSIVGARLVPKYSFRTTQPEVIEE
jgi:hypothetical protein